MRRVFLVVLDSLGIGALPDAERFGDVGAHTLDHLVEAAGGLDVPNLAALGLGNIAGVTRVAPSPAPEAAFGRLAERSPGKDTSTGHWEMMGCPLLRAFPTFPQGFPPQIIEPFLARTGLPGILGNKPASGTEILDELGALHLATGQPIVYTSADSVFQVAAHAEHFGLERLYEICSVAREILDPYGVGRVIARPFVGEPGSFRRTYDRRDFSMPPPEPTVLDALVARGIDVLGIGKIADIFAGRGVSEAVHTEGNADGMRATLRAAQEFERGLVFVNLVDFDMLFGHRRDARGYARALEEFDLALAELRRLLRPEDLLLLSADHGNDPTFTATTDHTREYVPILAAGPGVRSGVDLGTRESFADVGATVAEALGVPGTPAGRSFLPEILAR